MALNIQDLTIPEKLQAMEMLWDDICRNIPGTPSPEWHGKLLKQRERDISQGEDSFEEWSTAKADIRRSLT